MIQVTPGHMIVTLATVSSVDSGQWTPGPCTALGDVMRVRVETLRWVAG